MGDKTLGTDISFWNQKVNFNKMVSAGANFCYMKASQLYTDSMFSTYWPAAKFAGILRGAYHYLDWRSSEITQAQLFCDTMNGDWGELLPVLDLEMNPAPYAVKLSTRVQDDILEVPSYFGMNLPYTQKLNRLMLGKSIEDKNELSLATTLNYSYSPREVQGKVWNFLNEVEKITGVVPMIYCGKFYWVEWMTPDPAWLKYKFWLAWYADESVIKVPPPWTTWQLWQYTGNGNGPQYGSEGLSMDLDYYNGTRDQLYAWANTTPTLSCPPHVCKYCGLQWNDSNPIPPTPPTPPSYPAYTNKSRLNVRSKPIQDDKYWLGYLEPNSTIYCDNIKDPSGYYHFVTTTQYPNGGWVHGSYLTLA
jgi:lysozyme